MNQLSSLKRKISSQTVMAFILIIFGMIILVISLYMPPVGEVHPSVITVFGMVLAAAGAFMGIDLNFQLKKFAELSGKAAKQQDDSAQKS